MIKILFRLIQSLWFRLINTNSNVITTISFICIIIADGFRIYTQQKGSCDQFALYGDPEICLDDNFTILLTVNSCVKYFLFLLVMANVHFSLLLLQLKNKISVTLRWEKAVKTNGSDGNIQKKKKFQKLSCLSSINSLESLILLSGSFSP